MARQKTTNKTSRKAPSRGGNPRFTLFLIIILIVAVFLSLEIIKRHNIHMPGEESAKISKWAMPQRQKPVQSSTSSAQQPVALPPVEQALPKKQKSIIGHGSVAIIIDDMGGNLREAQALLGIPAPLTFSIIPGLVKSREVADIAHRNGHEVMLHIPMEPHGYENKPFEKDGLLLSMSDQELERRLAGYMKKVPYAVGANNHMGSRFTENETKMRTVLNQMKARGLYFIDSKTSPRSVGDRLAKEMGVDTAARTVFLDNTQDPKAIRSQLDQLATAAKKRGSAIGICHPHRITIQTLASTLPELKRDGITFVYASELAR